MDKETLKLLAEATAKAAAAELAGQLRGEIAEQFAQAKREIKDDLHATMKADLAGYFGEMKPAYHIVQHDRATRLFTWMDNTSEKFWGKIAINLLYIAVIGGIVLWVIGSKVGMPR